MTEVLNQDVQQEEVIQETEQTETFQSELSLLKEQARRMGISFANNANIAKMKQLIDEHIAKVESGRVAPTIDNRSEKVKIRDEAMKLVRIRIQVLNPAKQKWTGEYFTAGNDLIGHVTRFVPFNAEGGVWHVENILVDVLRSRKYQSFPEITDPQNKRKGTDDYFNGKLLPEFSIQILPPLTEEELKEIADRQAALGSVD